MTEETSRNAEQIEAEELADVLALCLDPATSTQGHEQLICAAYDDSAAGVTLTVQTFAEARVRPHNTGLVLTIGERQFQLTIVRTR